MKKKMACIFPGSFNPFHEGHLYIVEKALKKYFQKIYIVVSHNENKQWHNLFLAKSQIIDFLKNRNIDDSNIVIIVNEGLTTDIAKLYHIQWIVRGYRNKNDLRYEKKLCNQYRTCDPDIKYMLIKSSKIFRLIESKKIYSKNKL